MNKTATVFLLLCLTLVAFLFCGCQSASQSQKEPSVPSQQVPVVPFSKGPSGPPSMKGPSGPPPGAPSTPQAVTETENVRYSLPDASTMQVKN
jgi:hypothetical protein